MSEKFRAWKIRYTKDGNAYPALRIPAYCPICGQELILHDFRPLYYSVKGFYHCDFRIKCIYCGTLYSGGFPISRNEAKVLEKSKFKGNILTDEVLMLDLNDEVKRKLEAKLKEWGYW